MTPPALIADIGGTNVRFALVGENGEIGDVQVLKVKEFPDPAAAAEAYLAQTSPGEKPHRAAFGVASVVAGDRIDLTNHPWTFSIKETREKLGLERLQVVNDVLALTLAVPHLSSNDLATISQGKAVPDAPIVVVAPGTGLGAAALIPSSGGWIPVATEAGHATVAAVTAREAEIVAHLKERFGHVSYERIVSGPGLVNVYQTICQLDDVACDPEIDPATVVRMANAGENSGATETLRVFAALLGTFAGNMALTFCAQGGVFIGGGVPLKLGMGFDGAIFRRRFEEKGRFAAYLSEIPTALITHPTPALIGLAHAV